MKYDVPEGLERRKGLSGGDAPRVVVRTTRSGRRCKFKVGVKGLVKKSDSYAIQRQYVIEFLKGPRNDAISRKFRYLR